MHGPNAAVEERWAAWLLRRNRRGTTAALWIAGFLYPLFTVLDERVAPRAWPLYATRGLFMLATLLMFRVVRSRLFDRHPDIVSAAVLLLISLGITSATVFVGGPSSRDCAGLSL